MITIKYKSETAVEGSRYVGKSSFGGYRWCVQDANKPQFDASQGTCTAEDLPDDIRKKCDEYDGVNYACQWPR